MDDIRKVKENIAFAEHAKSGCPSEERKETIAAVLAEIEENIQVPCTGCGYCMPCPKGL